MITRRVQPEAIKVAGVQPESYCSGIAILFVVLLSFLLALLLTLAGLRELGEFWWSLGLNSLFVVWVGLLTLLLLCLIVRHRNRLSSLHLGLLAILMVQGLVLSFSFAFLGLATIMNRPDLLAQSDPELFVGRNLAIGLIVSLIVARYLALHDRWKRQVSAESGARLGALQSRIRPHFLFNTLNTISSLIHDRPDEAEQATLDLADLLRTGLKDESTHALCDELDLIRGYLRIEQLRLGERLNVQWDMAEQVPLDQQLPPLLLQPLVENAVIHGISRRAEGGTLRIEGRRIRFGRIRFTVTNPLGDPDSRPAEGNQSALENIRQRLALAYEERYGLKTRIENGHFIAELTIPVT